MTALHRLNISWAMLAIVVFIYDAIMTGTNIGLLMTGLGLGLVPALYRKASLPNLLVYMWFAFWAVALMVLPAPDAIDALAAFVLGTPLLFRTAWWIVAGFFTKK